MNELNYHGETFGTDITATVRCSMDVYESFAYERPRALGFGLGPVLVRSNGLALFADLEHACFMPPILHRVIRVERWPFSATGSGSLQASGGYGLSAEAQLHRYVLIRNIQDGWRKTRRDWRRGRKLSCDLKLFK
jgi:hypothetical protein